MTKTAFLFSGQGAQQLGMARDLYDQHESVKTTFDEASKALGYDLRALIDHDEEKLNETKYTQPAILTTSVAIMRLLNENGIKPDVVAGLSLGEYSALVASEIIDFQEAVKLVAKRGQYMTAILKPASEKLALELDKINFKSFELPLISNTSAKVMQEDEVKALLTHQVMEPVRFYESVETMQKLGVTRFIEVGPGKVLSGFIKKIDKNAEFTNVCDIATFEALISQ